MYLGNVVQDHRLGERSFGRIKGGDICQVVDIAAPARKGFVHVTVGPVPDDRPKSVPFGVERKWHGRRGETFNQALGFGQVEIVRFLDHRPDQGAVSRWASL